eukprot:scaffold42764_cov60-Attheya_sp.AAC.3
MDPVAEEEMDDLTRNVGELLLNSVQTQSSGTNQIEATTSMNPSDGTAEEVVPAHTAEYMAGSDGMNIGEELIDDFAKAVYKDESCHNEDGKDGEMENEEGNATTDGDVDCRQSDAPTKVVMEIGKKKASITKVKVHDLILTDLFVAGEKKWCKWTYLLFDFKRNVGRCASKKDYTEIYTNS